ncbi:hypothetical protein [Corynebacterium caspium]|uniref:hypothetical protein n=1 Tax=Corynebacterium caspium TaxID=234828 RepID=UPI00037CCA2B|nr:hypothetical protein [Corynebacterium caspium]WKD59779.1 hypothetical protein CCASP_07000 [Corynebacterium caspium DSM 44850]
MKRYETDPKLVLFLSLVFAALVIWQGNFGPLYWLPIAFGIWAIFTLANLIYVRVNNKISSWTSKVSDPKNDPRRRRR